MSQSPPYRTELNGQPADAEALRALAFGNYGHFTVMQVRDGAVQGLDLHLQRLADATQELFGSPLDLPQLRAWLRQIVTDAPAALSLRITIFSRAFDRNRPGLSVTPDVMVASSPARAPSVQPLRVASVRYQREAPHIKHVGTFGLFHQKRLAQLRGYDDAVFVDASGAIAEGSIWNIGFFDDDGVVWPQAPMLRGVSMQLLQQGLQVRGIASTTRRVALDEIGRFRGAFFTNSGCVALSIRRIDAVEFHVESERLALLETCHAVNAAQRL